MTFDEALQCDDAYAGMLEIACLLAEKAAAGLPLSPEEDAVRSVTWIDCQVCNGGWEQWMYSTSVEGLARALWACEQTSCSKTRALAVEAFRVAAIDPSQ